MMFMGWRRRVARTAWALFTKSIRNTMEPGTSRSFMLLRVARTERQAQLAGWFCTMAVSLARLPPAALMEAELFSSLGPGAPADSGISGRFIRSEASRTVVFPMARCCSIIWVISSERLITAEIVASALFINYRLDLWANGTRAYFIASRMTEPTVIARSAILLLTAAAICMGLRVRVAWVVALSLS